MARFLLFILTVLVVGCSTNKNLSTSNLAYLYQKSKNNLRFSAKVYHKNAVESELIIKIPSEQLLYTKKQSEGKFSSSLKLKYELLNSFDDKTIVDSNTVLIVDTNNAQVEKEIIGYVGIKIAYPGQFILKLTLTDQNRRSSVQKLMVVDKSTYTSEECFKAATAKDNNPIIEPFFTKPQSLIVHYQFQDVNKIFVKYYNRKFELPPPPFSSSPRSSFDYTPDSVFSLSLNDSGIAKIFSPDSGFYLLSNVATAENGFSIFSFSSNFPKLKNATGLIEPLRYICSNKEYEMLRGAENQKKAVDDFWLSLGGSAEETKVLIKNYYHHVEESNELFSSYVPGWKTDRGMIYIIFGSPDALYKDEFSETWIFGEENSPLSLTFNFIKVNNPFTKNDFRLTRSPMLKNPWYGAVDSWRKGKIIDEY